MMKIAIIGAGNIGGGLGRAWVRSGHMVTFAVRTLEDPDLAALLKDTGAVAKPLSDALGAADVIVLAVPFGAVPAVAQALPNWTGKLVIDCTNAVGPGFSLLVGHTDSAAEVNARLLPGARVVKSFTAQGAENLAHPVYDGVPATNFYCGDDAAAKDVVRGLIADIGFEPMDLGGLVAARYLEPMTFVWFAASRALGSRQIAFKILEGAASTVNTKKTGPSIVLVHGAWMGAASWSKVATNLRTRGFTATTVELPGHGADQTPAEALSLTSYVDAVVDALPSDGPVVLVGHSMAGMVISAVAERVPDRVSKLVYIAAYLPRDGESLYQLSQTDTGSLVPRYWRQEQPETYSPAWIDRDGIVAVFGADCSEADQQFLLTTHKPEALGPLATPVHLTAEHFGRVPRVYVHTLQDGAVSYALQRTMLANAGGAATVVALDASHVPMLSQPQAVADVIAGVAR